MKKSLIALAALAAAGAASAQSSVTLFGIVDVTMSHYSVGNGGSSATIMTNSGYNSSRLGFRGTEDLGGGLAASFWLEGSLVPDTGTAGGQTWTRRSTVSLSGGWGEVRLGRDYVPTFWNLTVFDPFGTNGVGTNLALKNRVVNSTVAADPAIVRSNNMIGYFLPANLGGIYGQVNYAFDEQPSNSGATGNQGRYWGARVGYAQGPFNVALAYGNTRGTSPTTLATPDVRDWNLGGQWDFGMVRVMGTYDNARYDADSLGSATLKSWMLGASVPVGAGEIRGSYGHSKLSDGGYTNSQWAIGYVHNLSKRTALYATYAHLKNKDGGVTPIYASLPQTPGLTAGATPNFSSNGFDLGIRHSF